MAPRKAPQLVLATSRDEFYVFNDQVNSGYVVISGDKRMPDVLAYSYDGFYDADHLPCNMQAWMEGYAEQVRYLRAHPEAKVSKRNATERENIGPLLTCSFGQDRHYNDKCPVADGEKANRQGVISKQSNWKNYAEEITECIIDPSFANLKQVDLSDFFCDLSNLRHIEGLEYLNTSHARDMSYMFSGCSSLKSLDLSGFNTENVQFTNSMFEGCSSLQSLELSRFDTENVTDMGKMFYGCSQLSTIYVGDSWNMSNVTNTEDMFWNCNKLVGSAGTTYDYNHIDGDYAHIDEGPSNPGYFTYKNPDEDAIISVKAENETDMDYYDLNGRKLAAPQRGLNIIRYSDGISKKVLIK